MDRGNQPISPLADGLDIRRLRGFIPERLAQLANRAMQHVVADEDVRPDPRHQLLAGHDLAGNFGERLEHLHHLGFQAHFFRAAGQAVE